MKNQMHSTRRCCAKFMHCKIAEWNDMWTWYRNCFHWMQSDSCSWDCEIWIRSLKTTTWKCMPRLRPQLRSAMFFHCSQFLWQELCQCVHSVQASESPCMVTDGQKVALPTGHLEWQACRPGFIMAVLMTLKWLKSSLGQANLWLTFVACAQWQRDPPQDCTMPLWNTQLPV